MNMKLKKRIKMFEDFASTSADASNSTTPSSATTSNSVAVDKTNTKSGEAIRTEVIKDVDAILNNLAELSNQITEDHSILLAEFEKASNAILEDNEPINEDFMAEIMKQVKSMKAYAKLSALYPKMKKNLLKAELTKVEKLQEFDATSDEKTAAYNDQLKAKYKEAIDAVTASDAPAIKKAQKKEALRQQRDAAIEKGADTVKNKLESEKTKLTKQLDDKIRDLNTKLTDLQANNKIEAELLQKQWASEKLKTDDEIEFKKIDQTVEIKNKYAADNPAQVEKNEKFRKAQNAKIKAESAEKQKERAEELAAVQKQFEDEKNAGTADQQEAKKKITDWFSAGNAYASYLGTVDFGVEESLVSEEAEIADEVKAKIKELRKAYSAANAAVSVATFKKAGSSEDEAEQQFKTFKEMVNGAVEEYSDQVDSIEGIDDEEKEDKTKSAEEVAKEALGDKFSTYSKIDNPEEMTDEVTDDAGNVVTPAKKKWKDAQTFKGKDKEGKDTEETVIYALPNTDENAGTATGDNVSEEEAVCEKCGEVHEGECATSEAVTESFAFKSGSVADRFRSLM